MELINAKYNCHIFVCVNERETGDCCSNKGIEILQILREHINKNGLVAKYNVTKTKCLGHCAQGPVIAIYPQGFIFKKVSINDTKKIIDEFLK